MLRQLREFLERRRWQEVLVVEEVASGSGRYVRLRETAGVSTHMDGARLFNASVATGISVADYAMTLGFSLD